MVAGRQPGTRVNAPESIVNGWWGKAHVDTAAPFWSYPVKIGMRLCRGKFTGLPEYPELAIRRRKRKFFRGD